MKRFIVILLIIAILGGAGYGIYQWQQQQQKQAMSSLQTAAASRGQLTSTIGATGQVHSRQTTTLFWETSGTVEKVQVEVGDTVKTGDILAELQRTSLQQNIILAEADLVNSQKTLDDLHTNAKTAAVQAMQAIAQYAQAVKQAQYQLDNYTVPTEQVSLDPMLALDLMEKRLNEARAAFEPYKFASLTDPKRKELKEKLDQAQSDYNAAVKREEYEYHLAVAQANLEKARQDYEKWKNGPDPAEIKAIEARIAAAEATLGQVWIKAPFDGVITLAEPQTGDQVSMSTVAFRLDDLSTLLVDVAISEVDINQIKVGQEAVLTFDAIRGKEYHGAITSVDRVGTVMQGVVDFMVTIELTDADEEVKPGMTAAVSIVINQLEDVLLVPNRAVRFRNGRQTVYVLRNNQPVPVTITLGASSDLMSEVLEGDLQVGDLIVLNPTLAMEAEGGSPFAP